MAELGLIHITGNLVNAYFICKRKFWLYARQFNPDPETDLLLLGRIISEESYKRERKEILFDGVKIDLIRREGQDFIVCEIKKSSKGLKAAIMQLAFYFKKLAERGVVAKGEILIPKEKRRIPFELTEELEKELEHGLRDMQTIMINNIPPASVKTNFCKSCAFFEFCFA
jgi:CRISPR-associated exonuclease Cas4